MDITSTWMVITSVTKVVEIDIFNPSMRARYGLVVIFVAVFFNYPIFRLMNHVDYDNIIYTTLDSAITGINWINITIILLVIYNI